MVEEASRDDPTYKEAVAELEAILAELDDDTIDVDVLAERVRRAAELIRVCRERITGARMEIERVVADLDGEGLTNASADKASVEEAP